MYPFKAFMPVPAELVNVTANERLLVEASHFENRYLLDDACDSGLTQKQIDIFLLRSPFFKGNPASKFESKQLKNSLLPSSKSAAQEPSL